MGFFALNLNENDYYYLAQNIFQGNKVFLVITGVSVINSSSSSCVKVFVRYSDKPIDPVPLLSIRGNGDRYYKVDFRFAREDDPSFSVLGGQVTLTGYTTTKSPF